MPSSNNLLKVSALRKFNGGLNVLDNDLSLKSHFATTLENLYTAPDGSLRLRYGVKSFADLSGTLTRKAYTSTNVTTSTSNAYFTRTAVNSATGLTTYTVRLYHPTGTWSFSVGTYIDVSGLTGTLSSSGFSIDCSLANGHRLITATNSPAIDWIEFTFTKVTSSTDLSVGIYGGPFTVTYFAVSTASSSISGNIVGIAYFQSYLICVTDDGEVVSIAGDGTKLIIWNSSIATEAGNSAGWVGNTFCSFAAFNDVLLICNGIDKPLRVDFKSSIICDYIKDPISGNVNTPICRYVTVVGDYVVMAGDPTHTDRVYFSNKSTYTTWYLDTAPNDATYYDTGKVVNTFDQTITGINRFRDKLLVFFTELTLIGSVGGYSNGVHVPVFDDTLQGHGCIAHNSAIPLGYDFLMCDQVGVPSLKRAVATTSFTPERVSVLIDPEIRTKLVQLAVQTQLDQVFAINNKRDMQYMLFVPDADSPTETLCYVFTNSAQLQISAWTVYRGWNFRCGCTSATNRVFFAKNKLVSVYGAYEDEFFDDFNGTPIDFVYETPWLGLESDQQVKLLRYIDFQTRGRSKFNCALFLDNFMWDKNNDLSPDAELEFGSGRPYITAELDFVAGDSGGYGVADGPSVSGEAPFGGGRRTNDTRTFHMGARFKSIKLRISGAAKKNLRIVSITLSYLLGSIR